MKKADNFNVKQWLTENKITTQSKLKENNTETSDLKSKNNNVHESYYAMLGGPSPLSDASMKTKVVEPVLGPNFETVMMFKDDSFNPRYKQLEAKFPREIIDKWKLLYRSDSYQGYAKLSPDGKVIKATILDDGGVSGVFYVKSGDGIK